MPGLRRRHKVESATSRVPRFEGGDLHIDPMTAGNLCHPWSEFHPQYPGATLDNLSRSNAGATTHVENVQAHRHRTEQLIDHRVGIRRPGPVICLGMLVEQLERCKAKGRAAKRSGSLASTDPSLPQMRRFGGHSHRMGYWVRPLASDAERFGSLMRKDVEECPGGGPHRRGGVTCVQPVQDSETGLLDHRATLLAKGVVVYHDPRASSDEVGEELSEFSYASDAVSLAGDGDELRWRLSCRVDDLRLLNLPLG